MPWYFTFHVIPTAKGRPHFVRKTGIAYTPKKTRDAEADLRWMIAAEWVGKMGMSPLECALSVTATFHVNRPSSVKPWKRPYPTVKPDLDNLLKLLKDAANKIIWKDDAQIVELHVLKLYSDRPRIELKIEEKLGLG
jgi:Holliday junction resolvase RusA-like endonuclease